MAIPATKGAIRRSTELHNSVVLGACLSRRGGSARPHAPFAPRRSRLLVSPLVVILPPPGMTPFTRRVPLWTLAP